MNTFKRRKKKTHIPPIKPEEQMIYNELCEIIEKLGIELRIEAGYFSGGYCILEDKPHFFVNRDQLIEQKIDLITTQLKNMDLAHMFISPRLRALIEEKGEKIEEQK
jgi:hypothetical protein